MLRIFPVVILPVLAIPEVLARTEGHSNPITKSIMATFQLKSRTVRFVNIRELQTISRLTIPIADRDR